MSNLLDMTGKIAIVSGGSGWLGQQMVQALANAGATVASISRSTADPHPTFSEAPGHVISLSADVTTDEWPRTITQIVEAYGRVDVLINNAHIGRGGSLEGSTADDFREGYELAVVSTATAIKAAQVGLTVAARAGGSPSVINIASMYGVVSPDPSLYETAERRNPPFYGVAKAALIQLTRYAAAELGPSGIRVNAIAPGPFPSAATQEDANFVDRLASRTMLRRIGRPEEIQSTILYLASPASSFVTGAVIPVDGGWTAW